LNNHPDYTGYEWKSPDASNKAGGPGRFSKTDAVYPELFQTKKTAFWGGI